MEDHDLILDRVGVIVFAKTLDVPVKTRILRTEGKEGADRIYRELLGVTAQVIKDLPYHVAFAGAESPGRLTSIFNRAVSFFPQAGEDLGIRMKNACLHCGSPVVSGFIVIGCDCPQRTAGDIMLAAQALSDGCNVVLGPVEDGGYHLAGVDSKGMKIFDATKWSSDELMEETLAIVEKEKLKVTLLPVGNDIDTIQDYLRWKSIRASGVYK
jgi:hypothetical protein